MTDGHTQSMAIREELTRLVRDRPVGWDRKAESLILRHWHGGKVENMVRHYLALESE